MRVHLMMIAVAGLGVASAVSAEPAKAPVRKAEQAAEQPPQVLVASAEQAPAAAPAEAAPAAPVKRERRARVTTCRCGDPSASN